jgi:cytochrome c oxidase subunit II
MALGNERTRQGWRITVGRLWSILFLAVPVLGVGSIVWAMAGYYPMEGHWLPLNISREGRAIDELFVFILYLTGAVFIGTSWALFWFMWKYDSDRNQEPVKYIHGSHTLEVVWSILPAATLLFIAIYQMNSWASAKMHRPTDELGNNKAAIAEITGRQFEWRIRYAGKNGILYDQDDVLTVNELHVPVDEEVVLVIKSEDVLHSFFLPNLRVKQDLVPGLKQFCWFKADRQGVYDIVCAELCGWGHYKMRGRLTVESRDKYEKWLADQYEAQQASEFTPASDEDE